MVQSTTSSLAHRVEVASSSPPIVSVAPTLASACVTASVTLSTLSWFMAPPSIWPGALPVSVCVDPSSTSSVGPACPSGDELGTSSTPPNAAS